MKTTLDLQDKLLARSKALAALERTTLTKLVEEGLALKLRREQARAPVELKDLPLSNRKGGLCEGLDGTSNRSLLDAAER